MEYFYIQFDQLFRRNSYYRISTCVPFAVGASTIA